MGRGKHVRCPECGRKLEVKDTLKRNVRSSSYFSTLAINKEGRMFGIDEGGYLCEIFLDEGYSMEIGFTGEFIVSFPPRYMFLSVSGDICRAPVRLRGKADARSRKMRDAERTCKRPDPAGGGDGEVRVNQIPCGDHVRLWDKMRQSPAGKKRKTGKHNSTFIADPPYSIFYGSRKTSSSRFLV